MYKKIRNLKQYEYQPLHRNSENLDYHSGRLGYPSIIRTYCCLYPLLIHPLITLHLSHWMLKNLI